MRRLFLGLLTFIFLMSLAQADIITPGSAPTDVRNVIVNINDYPEYVFLSKGGIPSMCPLHLIGSDGVIHSDYKFCGSSVYAVKKSEFNQSLIIPREEFYKNDNWNESNFQDYNTQVENYLNASNLTIVISRIRSNYELPLSSAIGGIVNSYEIDLNKNLTKPSSTRLQWNILLYVYILVALIAILVIIHIIRRRNK